MADITDLISAAAPESTTVPLGGMDVAIRQVSLIDMLRIIKRFPALKALFSGDTATLIDLLIDCGPDAVAAVLACATGHPGDKTVEIGIQALPDDALISLLAAAIRITMPDGVESFFARLVTLANAAGLLTESQEGSAEAA